MKIKSGFVTRKIGDKIVGVAVGKRTEEFNGMITLNETAQFIWKCLEKDTDVDKVISKVIKKYDIDENMAAKAVNDFVEQLKNYNLLDE